MKPMGRLRSITIDPLSPLSPAAVVRMKKLFVNGIFVGEVPATRPMLLWHSSSLRTEACIAK
jgi:hypothetical protein